MEAIHKTILQVNEEFLVSEAPAAPLLHALRQKDVLTSTDWEQVRYLEGQGQRAVKRFVVHVLPKRGPLAFPAFLESLIEARAQHLVDLLLEEERVLSAACKPVGIVCSMIFVRKRRGQDSSAGRASGVRIPSLATLCTASFP